MGSQRVRRDLVTEQQQQQKLLKYTWEKYLYMGNIFMYIANTAGSAVKNQSAMQET